MVETPPNSPKAGPVEMLLSLGEPKSLREFEWPDYRLLGIESEHIAALIDIATNLELIHLPDEKDPRGWGPVHAWRALGQLHASQAIEPLLRLFSEVRDNDWVIEEMPDVFALIGPAAFPALATYLRDPVHPDYSRLVAATSLTQLAVGHTDLRGQCVEELAAQLSEFSKNSPGANGVLIANLVTLQAAEKADLIQKVFTEGKVDRFIVGDWRDVKIRLRPSAARRTPTVPISLAKSISEVPPDPPVLNGYHEPHTRPRGPVNRS